MGGKGKGGAPPGGDAITWGPLARANGWGWDKEQPEAAAPEAPPAPAAAAAAAPEQTAVQEQATPAAAGPQGPIGEPTPPGQATGGSINTTQDTGGRLAQAITAAPSMWTDRLKKQGTDSMTTTGQV